MMTTSRPHPDRIQSASSLHPDPDRIQNHQLHLLCIHCWVEPRLLLSSLKYFSLSLGVVYKSIFKVWGNNISEKYCCGCSEQTFAITTDNCKLQISDLRKFPFKSKLISPACEILNTIKCKDLKTMRNDYLWMFCGGVFVTLVF